MKDKDRQNILFSISKVDALGENCGNKPHKLLKAPITYIIGSKILNFLLF